jgi:hypothetical protein
VVVVVFDVVVLVVVFDVELVMLVVVFDVELMVLVVVFDVELVVLIGVVVDEDVVVGFPVGGTRVVDGGAGVVGREGVAEQVLTCRPAVSDARPSLCIWSMKPGGSVPTYALKL